MEELLPLNYSISSELIINQRVAHHMPRVASVGVISGIIVTVLKIINMINQEEESPVPDNVAVILPIRFNKIDYNGIRFENNFTVSILDLPIKGDEKDVRGRFKKLRNSADPLTNYYFLKVCGLLPRDVLCPMFNSSQATMVFSNMPGPGELSISGGALKSLVFFVPNNGSTGLGITALCYGGVLRLAAMADSAVVPSSEKLSVILEGMVEEIKRLHNKYVKSC